MNLLTLVLALPLAGFLIALLMPRNSPQSSRMWALIASLVTFAASLGLLVADEILGATALISPLILCAAARPFDRIKNAPIWRMKISVRRGFETTFMIGNPR